MMHLFFNSNFEELNSTHTYTNNNCFIYDSTFGALSYDNGNATISALSHPSCQWNHFCPESSLLSMEPFLPRVIPLVNGIISAQSSLLSMEPFLPWVIPLVNGTISAQSHPSCQWNHFCPVIPLVNGTISALSHPSCQWNHFCPESSLLSMEPFLPRVIPLVNGAISAQSHPSCINAHRPTVLTTAVAVISSLESIWECGQFMLSSDRQPGLRVHFAAS